jgi:Heterokaryon incompatibility protein (HET)
VSACLNSLPPTQTIYSISPLSFYHQSWSSLTILTTSGSLRHPLVTCCRLPLNGLFNPFSSFHFFGILSRCPGLIRFLQSLGAPETMLESTSEAVPPIYSPLRSDQEEIRLATVEAADNPLAGIRCQVETVNLSSSPSYDALSYVWGDANTRKSITLNGIPVLVTTNLYRALKRLRARPGILRIWIDALCIDQSSAEEKSSQIPLMGKIYSQAEKVLIWVGEEEEDSGAAMALIQKWGAGAAAAKEQSPDTFWPNSLELTLQHVETPFDEREIKALGAFLSRDYWRRV